MVTNYFKIAIQFADFDVRRIPYSEEQLQCLRREHNHHCSFFRNGEFIYISPALGAELDFGETVRLRVAENEEIVGSLIRHLLFRAFRDANPDIIPQSFAPLRFASRKEEHDPIRKHLPPELRGKITFPRVIEAHVRATVNSVNELQFGLVIYSQHQWKFPVTLDELLEEGFDVKGRAVIESVPIPGLDGVLAPDENVLGVVEKTDGQHAIIQTNRGMEKRLLSALFLQRTYSQIASYLHFKLGKKAEWIFQNLKASEQERAIPGFFFGETRRVAAWLNKLDYRNADGFGFTVTTESAFTESSFRLNPTRLVFDIAPGASESTPLKGLRTYGPYDSSRFDRKSPRFLVIFHERNRGAAAGFVGKLINGIPDSRYYQQGLRDLFRLHEIESVLKPLSAQFAEDYEGAIDAAMKEDGGKGFDLALVECVDDSRAFPDAQNPYYRAKARLMGYGIPVQCIKESHLRAGPVELANTLGPTALQIYAKMGGIPWLLPGSQSVDHELIIGIGNTIIRENYFADAEQSRIVGLTTFFLGDGRYLVGRELRSVPYADYFEVLLESLDNSLRQVSEEYAWKEGATVRVVFHVFKPLKNVEVDVVTELVKRYPRFRILFAFVTISTKHPWFMFLSAERRRTEWSVELCQRGENIVLNPFSCLLQLRGPTNRPNQKHRFPSPVLIRLHEGSTFKDLQYLAQQILDFSYISWRSFFPNDTPVTVMYSGLLAKMTAKLARLRGWNPVILDTHFRRKKWFL